MSIPSASIVGSSRACSIRRDPADVNKIIMFVSQIILNDWLSQVSGNVVNPDLGADIIPNAVSLSNVGNNGFNLLTCDVALNNQLGGTDGSAIYPGDSCFFYLVTDDAGDSNTPPTKTGLVVSKNSTTPQNGFALTHGSLVYTNQYRGAQGFWNIVRTNGYWGFIDGDQPVLVSGACAGEYVYSSFIAGILPNAGDPSYLMITGSGTGRIKIWSSLGQASCPEFDQCVNGTIVQSFTLGGTGGFFYNSTDPGMQIKLAGIGNN